MPTRTHRHESPEEGNSRWQRKAAVRAGTWLAMLLLIAAPWFWGGMEPVAQWSLALGADLLLLALAASLLFRSRRSGPSALADPWIRAACLLVGSFAAFAAFQAVPLPASLARLLSPASAALAFPAGPSTLSVHPHATRDALVLLLSTAALFLAPLLLFSKGNRVSSATGLLSALGGAVGAYALLNYLSANETSFHFLRAGFGNRANGPFVNPNHLACYLGVLIGAPLAILFQVHRRSVSREEEPLGTRVADFLADLSRNYRKILAALAFLVMALALVFTLSRSGIVAGAAGVAAFLAAFAVLRRRRRGRRYGRVLAGTALFVVFAGTAAWIGLDPLVRRYASSDLSFGDRWVVWSSSLSLLADFPLFGSGLGTFSDVFPLHQPASIPAHYTYPHSEYVGLLVETGILGALLLAGSAVCGAVGFLRILGRKDLRRTRQLAACVGIAAAVAALVHSAFDFSLHIPAVGMAFAFTLGLGLTASLASESRGRHRSQRGRTGEEEEDEEDEEEAEDVKTAGAITAPEGGDAARGDGAAVPCPGSKPESPAQGGE